MASFLYFLGFVNFGVL